MLNHITVMGRLTHDPELKKVGNDISTVSFRIACDRDFKGKDGEKGVDFINCKAWRGTADFIAKYFGKGRMVVVDGRLEMREYTDKEGNKRTASEINVQNAYFADSKKDSSDSGSYTAPTPAPAADFEVLEDPDPTLPF